MKYRKKPVTIDAFQFDGTVECLQNNVNKDDWESFAVGYEETAYGYSAIEIFNLKEYLPKKEPYEFRIHTLEGPHRLREDDYVIKGVHGEYYPCKPDIFKGTYEPVKDDEVTYRYSFKFVGEYASIVSSIPDSEMDGIIDKVRAYMQDQIESYLYKKTLNEE